MEADARCDECGFDAAYVTLTDAIELLESMGARWLALLVATGSRLRVRPAPDVWSPIEYAVHIRDVLHLHAWAFEQVLTVERPVFPVITEADMEEAVAGAADAAAEPVAEEIGMWATRLAELAAGAAPEAWSRTGRLGERTLDLGFLVRHALHDALHHLRDVERSLVAPSVPVSPQDSRSRPGRRTPRNG